MGPETLTCSMNEHLVQLGTNVKDGGGVNYCYLGRLQLPEHSGGGILPLRLSQSSAWVRDTASFVSLR